MTHFNIYGKYEPTLNIILDNIISQIKTYNDMEVQKSGERAYEHLIYRVKDKDSMLEKCTRKNLPQTTYSALHDIQDAIGIRIICRFIDDIYKNIDYLKSLPNLKIIKEKDYTSYKYILSISMVGIIVFLLIWENRSRYLVNIIPLLLINQLNGIEVCSKIKRRKEE